MSNIFPAKSIFEILQRQPFWNVQENVSLLPLVEWWLYRDKNMNQVIYKEF